MSRLLSIYQFCVDVRSCGAIMAQQDIIELMLANLGSSNDELMIETTRLVAQLCRHGRSSHSPPSPLSPAEPLTRRFSKMQVSSR